MSNLNEKYVLVNYISGERATWNGGIILFRSAEDAEYHNNLFKNLYNLNEYSIIPVDLYNFNISNIKCVNYNDIKDSEEYQLFKNSPDTYTNTPPYLLVTKENGYIRWECDDVILFNSDEEIDDFIYKCQNFLNNKVINCRLVASTVIESGQCVYYKDIANIDNFEEKIREYQINE